MAFCELSDRILAVLDACGPAHRPIDAAISLLKEVFQPYGDRPDMTYRYEHSLRVGLRGQQIADGEGWIREPFVIACLLHDIGYAECTEQRDFAIHQQISAEIAAIFLKNIGYDPKTAGHICRGIFLHNLWNNLPGDADAFELSVRDADDLDRFDVLRIYRKGASLIGDFCASEIAEMCRCQLAEIREHGDRICGTETARKLWDEQLRFRERYYTDLLNQMEAMDEFIQNIDNSEVSLMPYETLLTQFTAAAESVFTSRLTGVYLHGSAAMDCFNPAVSDLDLIVVIDGDITDTEKLNFMAEVVRLNESAPAKGIEISVVQLESCRHFTHPAPYELHFSPSHLDLWNRDPAAYIQKLHGTDRDLAAHFTVIRQYGRVLSGAPVNDVFGEISRDDYIDSLLYDVGNACKDILEAPTYMTLNLCRVLAYLRDSAVLSKKSGGQWGLKFLPERYHILLKTALDCYTGSAEMEYPQSLAVDFAGFMLAQIEREQSECRFPAPTDPVLEDMSGFFERRVDGYDEHMIANVEGCKEGYPLMASLVPAGTKHLLDLGCGTGLELDEIFRLHPDVSVTAVDLCRAMLDKLQEKHPDKTMNLICGDYFTADFGSGYDCAVSFETMHHFTPAKKVGLYKKIADALTPHGCYIECDYMVDTQEQEDHWFAENRRIRAQQNIPEDAFFHFDTPCTMENQKKLLLDAGFASVELVFRKGGTAMMVARK